MLRMTFAGWGVLVTRLIRAGDGIAPARNPSPTPGSDRSDHRNRSRGHPGRDRRESGTWAHRAVAFATVLVLPISPTRPIGDGPGSWSWNRSHRRPARSIGLAGRGSVALSGGVAGGWSVALSIGRGLPTAGGLTRESPVVSTIRRRRGTVAGGVGGQREGQRAVTPSLPGECLVWAGGRDGRSRPVRVRRLGDKPERLHRDRGEQAPEVDGEDCRPDMFAGVAVRLEVGATATGDELLTPEPEPDPIFLGPPDPRHDLAGRACGDDDPVLGEVRLTSRNDAIGQLGDLLSDPRGPVAAGPPALSPTCPRSASGVALMVLVRVIPGTMPCAGGPDGRGAEGCRDGPQGTRPGCNGGPVPASKSKAVAPTTHPMNLR